MNKCMNKIWTVICLLQIKLRNVLYKKHAIININHSIQQPESRKQISQCKFIDKEKIFTAHWKKLKNSITPWKIIFGSEPILLVDNSFWYTAVIKSTNIRNFAKLFIPTQFCFSVSSKLKHFWSIRGIYTYAKSRVTGMPFSSNGCPGTGRTRGVLKH